MDIFNLILALYALNFFSMLHTLRNGVETWVGNFINRATGSVALCMDAEKIT